MQLRWTREAADDLEHIADYLLTHTPDRANELVRTVYDAPSALLTFPNRGRPGKKEGTRELVLTRLPYIVVYKVADDVIFVVRILHGAQKWP
ncbi:MAG: type II toxin-antitoxin system RelE/ParE family toxin [Vicinamibacterales bacterium]